MTVRWFGKATAIIIALTAFFFLSIFTYGVRVSPALMAPWSAVAFAIIGLTLWIEPSPLAQRFPLHTVAATLVFTIGAIVCAEHIWNVGSTQFDRLLFPGLLPQTPLPGRPAPLAGSRYCLLGIMLYLLRGRNRILVLAREWTAV